jgi:hypothetical protein
MTSIINSRAIKMSFQESKEFKEIKEGKGIKRKTEASLKGEPSAKRARGQYGKIVRTSNKGPVKVKNSATEGRWRMSKEQDAKITSKLKGAIEASTLYPVALIESVKPTADAMGWFVTFKNDSAKLEAALRQLPSWVIVGNGDGQESAVVVTGATVYETGRGAMISKSACVLSAAKLKRAMICVGPQPTCPVAENVFALTAGFPKSKHKLALQISTFNRLQSLCK